VHGHNGEHMNRDRGIVFGICLNFLGISAQAAMPEAAQCARLLREAYPTAKITSAEAISTGEFVPATASAGSAAGKALPTLPSFCRAVAILRASAESSISVEVWLPQKWNHRYLQAGNSGFAGSIAYGGMANALRQGFAVASSDGGHRSEGADAKWGMNSPERIADFGNRALHETALFAKALVDAYYGKPAKRSYFSGCSDGGRESLMAAQRYPEEFDGWLVGAPENDFTRLLTTELFLAQVSSKMTDKLSPTQLRAIGQAALSKCDPSDGLNDGLIADPRACHFSVATLICKSIPDGSCLSSAQADAVERLYSGWRDGPRHLYFPGLGDAIGTEGDPGQWQEWLSGMVPDAAAGWHEAYAQQFFEYIVYATPGLDIRSLDPGDAYEAAVAQVSREVDANDTDLSRVRAQGKKIIQFHGWSDVGIPPEYSLSYYQAVEQKLGSDLSDFYRLFMVPGMGHCGGGPGPNRFGQAWDSTTPFDPGRNMLAALVRWVETGQAPDHIIATKYRDDDARKNIVRTRPLCPYPRQAHYLGKGSINTADNFVCR
jgi:hypothetical protein